MTVMGDFNTPLSPIIYCPDKVPTKILEFSQLDSVDFCKVSYPAAALYIFFSAAHGTFFKIDHILGHKASRKNFKKIEITPCILLGHNGIKLEINSKETTENIQTLGD
jgi:hypothetical protein